MAGRGCAEVNDKDIAKQFDDAEPLVVFPVESEACRIMGDSYGTSMMRYQFFMTV